VSAISQDEAVSAAAAVGAGVFVVDCDRARSRSAVLRAVVKAVDFPEFFGGNLDALYDCLCDTVLDQKTGLFIWFDNLHSGDPALADDAAAIIGVCNDVVEFAANNERHFAYAVQHAGKHPDPEPGVSPTPYAGHRSHE
jgi:RNAse (barnase) inhibitor barstar